MDSQALIAAAVSAFQQGDLQRARRIAEEELAPASELPLVQHLLGLIDCRVGRFDSGIEHLRRACHADPVSIPYKIALTRALLDGGRADEALLVAAPPAGTTRAELGLWQMRAEAAFYAGDRSTEAEAWRAICRARPQDAMAWTNLGRSLLVQFKFAEAEAAYREALKIGPALVIRHELGLTLERSNRLEALGELLDDALADGVPKERLADLWAMRALRAGDIDEAARMAEAIDIRPDPFRLNGLKAKIADAAGRPAEAFAAALAMNSSVGNPGAWRAQGRAYRDELRKRRQDLASWLPTMKRLPPGGRRSPAFLVGFPRSGTTLADTFLRGHPDVRVLEEVPILEHVAQSLGGIGNLRAVPIEQLTAARDDYFAALDEQIEPAFMGMVVDKMPLNMLSLPLIACLFPDARIIFAQRHPCDCVLSAFMQPFLLTNAMANFLDIVDAADFYDAALGLFTEAQECLGLPVHTLVYENLVTDPASTMRSLTEFLDLEWRPELLDHRATAAGRGAIKTPSYDSVSEPLSSRRRGRWNQYEPYLAPALPALLPWAKRLGYRDN
ncbi:MAG: tetratricopeptide repeat protein [Sphingomonas sp.]|nr:tetratricopeptide repeat protein [Sphingomonas sp.]